MIYYNLDKDISGEKILSDIQNLVSKHKRDSPENIPILCIYLKTIAYDTTDIIPKLEYKPNDDCTT